MGILDELSLDDFDEDSLASLGITAESYGDESEDAEEDVELEASPLSSDRAGWYGSYLTDDWLIDQGYLDEDTNYDLGTVEGVFNTLDWVNSLTQEDYDEISEGLTSYRQDELGYSGSSSRWGGWGGYSDVGDFQEVTERSLGTTYSDDHTICGGGTSDYWLDSYDPDDYTTDDGTDDTTTDDGEIVSETDGPGDEGDDGWSETGTTDEEDGEYSETDLFQPDKYEKTTKTSRSGLSEEAISQIESILPTLVESSINLPQNIQDYVNQAQTAYDAQARRTIEDTAASVLEDLSGRNMLDSTVATDALSGALSDVANESALAAMQAGLEGAGFQLQVPEALGSIAALGEVSTEDYLSENPLQPYELYASLLQSMM